MHYIDQAQTPENNTVVVASMPKNTHILISGYHHAVDKKWEPIIQFKSGPNIVVLRFYGDERGQVVIFNSEKKPLATARFLPKYLLMVLAFAGDSTTTTELISAFPS